MIEGLSIFVLVVFLGAVSALALFNKEDHDDDN